MHIQTDHLPDVEAERTAGILEDRHDEHLTTQARRLAEGIVALFKRDDMRLWDTVSDSLFANPVRIDWMADTLGLPRPTDAVKSLVIGMVRSKGLAAALSPIPPASQRPVCVLVGWLAEHGTLTGQLEYLDADDGWLPAWEATRRIDPGWPVEVRQALHIVGGA